MYYKLYKPGYFEKILLTECGRIVTSNWKEKNGLFLQYL